MILSLYLICLSMVFFLTLFTRKSNLFSYSINNPWLFYFTSAFFSPLTGMSIGPGDGAMVIEMVSSY